jgi:hypothetical protein
VDRDTYDEPLARLQTLYGAIIQPVSPVLTVQNSDRIRSRFLLLKSVRMDNARADTVWYDRARNVLVNTNPPLINKCSLPNVPPHGEGEVLWALDPHRWQVPLVLNNDQFLRRIVHGLSCQAIL